jgi:hypothetical protein
MTPSCAFFMVSTVSMIQGKVNNAIFPDKIAVGINMRAARIINFKHYFTLFMFSWDVVVTIY